MYVTRDEVENLIQNQVEEFPQRSHFWGTYYGLVEAIDDPLRMGRLKVRTPVHFDTANIPTEMLPWAHYVSPSGGDTNLGFYAVPPVGAQVAVSFIDGNPQYPVWLGTVWGAPNGVSESYVSSADENNPYGVNPVPAGYSWDYTNYNSFTTKTGLRIQMDDNLDRKEVDNELRGVNFRRIDIDIPGDVVLTYTNPIVTGKH